MATKDMAVILGGRLLPKFTKDGFKRIYTPNEKDNVTLGGTLFTYFKNNRRTWQIKWSMIKEDGFQVIEDLYLEQYELSIYHPLQIDAFGIITTVKMNMNNPDIVLNGGFYRNVVITLQEKAAIS